MSALQELRKSEVSCSDTYLYIYVTGYKVRCISNYVHLFKCFKNTGLSRYNNPSYECLNLFHQFFIDKHLAYRQLSDIINSLLLFLSGI